MVNSTYLRTYVNDVNYPIYFQFFKESISEIQLVWNSLKAILTTLDTLVQG